jgi:hypothetical protein
MSQTKARERHIKRRYLDKNAGFAKPDGLLSGTPILKGFQYE